MARTTRARADDGEDDESEGRRWRGRRERGPTMARTTRREGGSDSEGGTATATSKRRTTIPT
jgi:hypothetical protein